MDYTPLTELPYGLSSPPVVDVDSAVVGDRDSAEFVGDVESKENFPLKILVGDLDSCFL